MTALASTEGADEHSWFSAIRKAWHRERPVTTREAASVLGKAAAAKRERDNRTLEERKAAFHARLSAERDGGWPVPPATINKELAR